MGRSDLLLMWAARGSGGGGDEPVTECRPSLLFCIGDPVVSHMMTGCPLSLCLTLGGD